jgi:hypothetical protein
MLPRLTSDGGKMGPERRKALAWALVAAGVLAGLIALGSRRLAHFDAALVGYTFATLFATFAITYRHVMWLQRPSTALYWRRGWRLLLDPRRLPGNLRVLGRRALGLLALNSFIWHRGRLRWAAHWLIMWGCLAAFAVTFPLVFGWIHFETVPGDLDWYRAYLFGFPTLAFPVHSWAGFLVFHALVWASFLVIAGVMLAFWRRLRDGGAAALQQFGEDVFPLVLLFAISVTGLMLTASYTWLKGAGYEFLALAHAIAVIAWLLWLPFGKFFHVIQRPAQVGVALYKEQGRAQAQAHCRRCGQAYASVMQVDDLEEVLGRLGYAYDLPGGGHYQEVCPACRRALFGLSQALAWHPTPPGPTS